jgi:hypothetical protein
MFAKLPVNEAFKKNVNVRKLTRTIHRLSQAFMKDMLFTSGNIKDKHLGIPTVSIQGDRTVYWIGMHQSTKISIFHCPFQGTYIVRMDDKTRRCVLYIDETFFNLVGLFLPKS